MATDPAFQIVQPATLRWSLVVPVKVLAQAKSRLTGLGDLRRSDLALAMAADTVAAAVAARPVAAVLVVTDDQDVAEMAAGVGAVVLADEPGAGLNDALTHGARYAEQKWPQHGRAGLAGDLPAVSAADLAAALDAAAGLGQAFVPDAAGVGTTLYAATPGVAFRPHFGLRSRAAHRRAGAGELDARASLRQDVDTVEDLRRAAAIGLGPRTLALFAGSDLARA
ncbi:MAG TPA: 2-phospho-L-lactate guanylyltransferase [Streptosporangiaceae bacterium]|jgi:2-phospho-L-lactate guanylyltransferase